MNIIVQTCGEKMVICFECEKDFDPEKERDYLHLEKKDQGDIVHFWFHRDCYDLRETSLDDFDLWDWELAANLMLIKKQEQLDQMRKISKYAVEKQ